MKQLEVKGEPSQTSHHSGAQHVTRFGRAAHRRTMLAARRTLAWLMPLLLACDGGAPGADTTETPAGDSTAVTGMDTSTTPTSTASQPAAVDSAYLALEGGGLRVFLRSTGSARPLPFGTPSADARSVLRAVLGTEPTERGENVDCGVEYARWEDGLMTWFANGAFVGWSLERGSTLTTVSGIGLGATRAELEAAYDVEVAPTSLGEEFTAGSLAGLLESAAADARVQHLWSGQTCIAR